MVMASVNFVITLEPLVKSWFNVRTTQISIFTLFVSAAVLYEGVFFLWVFLLGSQPAFICWKSAMEVLFGFEQINTGCEEAVNGRCS